MPSQVTNYKCPACTGPLHFAGDSGKLECEYCGSSFEVAEIEAMYAEKEAAAANAAKEAEAKAEEKQKKDNEWDFSEINDWGDDGAKMKAYNCPSCGAELICEETTAATSCPYCGNPTIVPGQFSGMLKPDYVIPFKLGKEDAVNALKQHYKGKKFLPKAFADANHLEEIKGIYVPFWLFDGVVDGNISYEGTRSHTHTEGDEEVTITEHYHVDRAGSVPFERIPADASSKMPDDYMDSIEPFDYGDLKPFSTAYLPGFLADKYDVTVEECSDRADDRAKQTVRDLFYRDAAAGYEACVSTSEHLSIQRGKVHYAMMPVWILNTKWNGQDFLFAMNGQTGKIVGDLPVSKGKFWLTLLCIDVVLTILLVIIMALIY